MSGALSNTHDHCDGATCTGTTGVTETVSPATQNGVSFRIHGMDCAEEVAILKRALADHVPEDNLRFDVLSGRMTVPEGVAAQLVVDAVRATGMRAEPWQDDRPDTPGRSGLGLRDWLVVVSIAATIGLVWPTPFPGSPRPCTRWPWAPGCGWSCPRPGTPSAPCGPT